MTPAERWIAASAPGVAMLAVIVGLGAGAPTGTVAAVVQASPGAAARTGLALQVRAFETGGGGESPLASAPIRLRATRPGTEAAWDGTTNADGIAEAWLPLRSLEDGEIEVRAGDKLLARGRALAAHDLATPPAPPVWMPFARRQGPLRLEVAVLGQRVAPGVAATLCVRVTDERTGRAAEHVTVAMDDDPSWIQPASAGHTDAAGWTEMVATPVGLAISLALRAHGRDGAAGEWLGGVFVAPGAPRLETRARWAPGETPEIVISAATLPATQYVEVDDVQGRAWATTIHLAARGDRPAEVLRVRPQPPGLYWALATDDPAGPLRSAAGTAVRPFFVAADDTAAIAYGTDPDACERRDDPRQAAAALWPCLAVAPVHPAPRWIALDGLPLQRARLERRRNRGLWVAVGAVLVAACLEIVILLRAAWATRALFGDGASDDASDGASDDASDDASDGAWMPALARTMTVAVALLVGLLGFVLLSAFLLRAG